MRKTIKYTAMVAISVGLLAAGYTGATVAQHSTFANPHQRHANINTARVPTEGGQGAFAALAEVVAILEADTNTDWSKVNINRLRDHLVDMNSLTLKASVVVRETKIGAEFTVTGKDITLRAIQSMVPAHSKELDKMPIWNARAKFVPGGASLTVTSSDMSAVKKIKALGFFGLMATGSHHQPHHLGMAVGQMVH